MKKLLILSLLLVAIAGLAAVVTADTTLPVPVEPTVDLETVLPSTVLDHVTTAASCKWDDIYCLDVYDPVTCSNGVTYSNACYARRACATGCGASGS